MELSNSDITANNATKFHRKPADSNTDALPCIEVGGVQVYAYVRDGILVVSLHYDTTGTGPGSPFRVYGEDAVPTVITAGDEQVWQALPDDAVTEAGARILRRMSVGEPNAPEPWIIPDWALGNPEPDTADSPAVQAERDALMPLACGTCGAEVDPDLPGNGPEHFSGCPRHPDAVADAKSVLAERILNRAGHRDRAATEALLTDLLCLAEDSLGDGARDELVQRVLRSQPYWEVAAGDVVTVQAGSAAEAVAVAVAEQEELENGKGYEPDPNPRFRARRAGDAGPWQRVDFPG
jgi:hypothetical protein